MTPKHILGWTGALVASGGAITLLLWGVPYYIDNRVDARVSAELEAKGPDGAIAVHEQRFDSIDATLGTIRDELAADRLAQQKKDEIFLQFLQCQANPSQC